MTAHDNIHIAGGQSGQDNLFDIVQPVKVRGPGRHIAVLFRAVGRLDDQIEVVLKLFAGLVRPHQGDLQRLAGGDRLSGVLILVRIQSGIFVFEYDGFTRGVGADGGRQIHPSESLRIVRWSGHFGRRILTGHDLRTVDQHGLDERSARFGDVLRDQIVADNRRGSGDQRRRHAGAAVEHEQRIGRGRPTRALGRARARRQDSAARRHDIGLHSPGNRRAAAAERNHPVCVIRHLVRFDRVGRKGGRKPCAVERDIVGVDKGRAQVLARAHRNAVFRHAGGPDRAVVDNSGGFRVNSIIAGRKADCTVPIVPNEIIHLIRRGVIRAGGGATPGVRMNARAVVSVGRRK